VNLQPTDTIADADLGVVGGGMAGLCAALAAAREGARTVLIHNRPVLGGNGSTECRVPFSGAGSHNPSANETGIIFELITEERAQSPYGVGEGMVGAWWDLILHDAVRREPNLTALLNTEVQEVRLDGPRLASVKGRQAGSERVWEVFAKLFVDATGDGVVGVMAGVPFRIGSEGRGEYGETLAPAEPTTWTLGSSLYFRARDCGRPMPYTRPEWAELYPDETCLHGRHHSGYEGGYWWIEIGEPFHAIADNEAIRDELLRHVLGVWDHIKNHCEHRAEAANHVLEWVGMLPAKRESRRFIGAHVLTQNEIQQRELLVDRVAYGGWIIDDHTRGGILARGQEPSFDGTGYAPFYVVPYSVPLSSMYAAHVPNLLFAGRCLSASRVVFNSMRVQRTLAVAGQAAGTAAALCAREGLEPRALGPGEFASLQQSLLRQDCWIPRVRNQHAADLARRATVTASSALAYAASVGEGKLELSEPLAALLPVSAKVDEVRVWVSNGTRARRRLRGTLHRAEDLWDLPALERTAAGSLDFEVPAGHVGEVRARCTAPLHTGLYWLRLEAAEGVSWLQQSWAPPGMTAAMAENGNWLFAPGHFSDWTPFAADVLPEPHCYEPGNVTNGVSRPEQSPNVWISTGPAPQWLRLAWASPVQPSTIQIAWGLNFHRSYFQMGACFRAPEIVRDYRIIAETEEGERVWAEVRGNYHRLKRHSAPQGLAPLTAIRLEMLATNGAARAEVDEVRVY
jgi:hypothetical protein